MRTLLLLVLALALVTTPACAIVGSPYYAFQGEPYGMTRHDLDPLEGSGLKGGRGHAGALFLMPVVVLWLLDLPFAAILDTALLPISGPIWAIRQLVE